ncbi:hypothetical protein BESB_033870 [Besnoitia besnoiti]|uniref:SAG-related sequence n=1 Tax=Besnoitia besnoiti TaxID=94643 RepID=A0A2A9MG86_BESBE|nr:hypothetical protein BESB_033870 [Besnoitia besnoiti]PFH36929.1 hypothetical protein BESB_033870 [Besnoitia besnoiti]
MLSGECDALVFEKPQGGNYTCEPADKEKGIELTLKAEAPGISFSCGSTPETKLQPSQPANHFYKNEQCQQPTPLEDVCVGTTIDEAKSSSSPKEYTLTVGKGKRKGETLYYSCEPPQAASAQPQPAVEVSQAGKDGDAKNKVRCVVKIIVEPTEEEQSENQQTEPPQGGNGGSGQVTECNAGTLTASASSESPLAFNCEAGMSLLPVVHENVLDGKDGNCTEEVALASLVDGELQTARDTKKEIDVYTLKINKDPEHNKTMCYKCVMSDKASSLPSTRSGVLEKKQCLLKVSVKGTSGAASSANSLLMRCGVLMGSLAGASLYFIF